ncbi:phospholipid carrier-dependent glycosyltransferase [Brasilonema bromeliae]|uniref:Phospholipid carrier-dependent glycosyltransferase n=1 Tax=Brasilonema bromeliae SPC951 TaxID=385972 RepID=A0ABX1PDV6_9CYAN|nr:phospholipid carrier-dependent glycosyltransferase [Brasilonema bromeliae]NMG22148.1 phospholipid carrier-dependent glycosyltransferase [Brasilonema bromeliae SPC951]
MTAKDKQNRFNSLLILGIIWLLGALCDRIWFALDRSVPAWDQADYLTGSLNYWHALQNPQWFNQEWWQSFWLLSSKIPPLTYIVTAIVQNIFGIGPDQATLMMLLFSAILLTSVYGLGTVLFSETVGLWAAALCQILPALYDFRLEFLLDYPLTAVVTLSFFCLTVWRITLNKEKEERGRILPHSPPLSLPHSLPPLLWAVAFGLTFGLALMVKQTALFFLLTPIVWVGVGALRHRRWGRLLQLLGGLCFSVLVFGPWYRTNWLIILTSGKRATIDSAIAEHQPGLDKLESWIYYWNQLPYQVSLPLLFVPLVSLLIWWGRSKFASENPKLETITSSKANQQNSSLTWLLVFWVGGYFLSCLNINKHERYVLPYLPVLTVLLAYGLTRWRSLFGSRVRWGTFGIAVILMLLNLFPVGGVVGGWVTQVLSPNAQRYPYMKEELPHRQVIAQIIQTEPHLRSTLGVLPSTPEINQHNFNYYGALQNFQVYGRQVGTRKKYVDQDGRSLEWFLTKTGEQGPVKEAQAAMVKTVEQGGNFQLNKSWNLPDNSQLMLYHQQTPTLEVRQTSQQNSQAKIALSQVIVPEKAPPGVPVPVSYEWSGSWDELQHGLVLLTWKNKNSKWIHDHGIAMGTLHPGAKKPEGTFQVIEKMAMLPPSTVAPGTYTPEAIYLNRLSGESYPVSVPKVTLQIDAQATATQAPELDLVSQLETLGAQLPKGTEAVSQVFEEVGRINQYDAIQDYLVQARLTLEYRLQHFTPNRDWAYALALANVLQRRVEGAIASLKQVTHLDPENPYAHAYLAFVQLYNWQPAAAQKSLEPSLAKNPNLPEFRVLSGVAGLMQGDFVKAWKDLSTLRK